MRAHAHTNIPFTSCCFQPQDTLDAAVATIVFKMSKADSQEAVVGSLKNLVDYFCDEEPSVLAALYPEAVSCSV